MTVSQSREAPVEHARPAGRAAPSFEEFAQVRATAMFRAAYALTGNRPDAEDLVQVTLVKLHLSWRRARRARSVEAYAHRVLVNAFLSGRRPARFTRERLVAVAPEVVAPRVEPEDGLDLWDLVQELPPRQRAVVVLRYVVDLTEADIADALGMAPGTVKSTASTALRALRRRMEEDR